MTPSAQGRSLGHPDIGPPHHHRVAQGGGICHVPWAAGIPGLRMSECCSTVQGYGFAGGFAAALRLRVALSHFGFTAVLTKEPTWTVNNWKDLEGTWKGHTQ